MADAGDKIYKESLDVFYGGISDDARIQKPEVFQVAQHFDIWTNPKALTPYRDMEADVDITTKAYKIDGFAYENSGLWGIGRKSGGTKNKVYQKTTGSSISSAWAAAPSGESTSSNAFTHVCCIAFHDRLYMDGPIVIDSWGTLDPSGSYTEAAYSPGGVPACQGIITTDDLLIIPILPAGLAVKDGAGSGPTDAWSTPISFPNNRQIRDLCEWGDFVAIAMHPGGGYNGQIGSKVFLWDKASSDPSHVIDWGEGHLLILENIEGTLIGVSQIGYGEEGIIKQKLVVRQYTGGDAAEVIFELEGDGGSGMAVWPNLAKVKDGNRLIFGVKFTKDGVSYNQLAAIGRKTSSYPWSFTLDRLVDNQNAITEIDAAFKLGQTVFVAYNGDGSINRTDDSANYTTSTYISQKRNGSSVVQDAARRRKVLAMAGVLTELLTSGQSVSLYCRRDAGTWELIRTYTYGDDATPGLVPANMGFEAGKLADGTDFSNWKEIEFKATSAGGAKITGIPFAWKFAGADTLSE